MSDTEEIVEHCQYCRSTKIHYCSYILKVASQLRGVTFSIIAIRLIHIMLAMAVPLPNQ